MAPRSSEPADMDAEGPHDLLHVFPSFEVGGSQRRAATLMAELGPSFRHAVCSLSGNGEARGLLPEGFPLEWVPAPPKGSSASTARALRTLLLARRPHLLLTYNWGSIDALAACWLLGSRRPGLVHHEDGFGPDEAGGPKIRRSLARRLLLRRADRVVVPSRRLESLAAGPWGVGPGRLERIPNGIDLERFRAGEDADRIRAGLGIGAEAFVLGSVGSLRAEKNVARLLAVPEQLGPDRPVHVLVVGDGPELPALVERARRCRFPDRIHFAGAHADPAPFYRAFDAFALTSDTEQMPVALVEAMASSLPVIATDVGDVASILPPEQGALLVALRPRDLGTEQGAEGLARCLAELLDSRGLGADLGRLNRERAEAELSLARMVQRYEGLYRSAARGSRSRPDGGAGGPQRP